MAPKTYATFAVGDLEAFMDFALIQAQKSPPAGNKFCVGALLVDAATGKVLSTGYSLEYPRDYKGDLGTTHAEHMEPCNERLSGNMTCATRISRPKSAIKTVYERLEANGAKVVFPVEHRRDRIIKVSMTGHRSSSASFEK
ncbi:hypothetical protein EDB80DRAFT_746385 [Ilyonectria destructans]|nr:hypothetical protein EDB80DRAFT_746385 [Ilyonectria destructans]